MTIEGLLVSIGIYAVLYWGIQWTSRFLLWLVLRYTKERE